MTQSPERYACSPSRPQRMTWARASLMVITTLTLAMAVLSSSQARAQTDDAAASESQIDPKARQVLADSFEYVSKQDQLSYRATLSISGTMMGRQVDHQTAIDLVLDRPNQFRIQSVKAERPSPTAVMVISDGDKMMVYSPVTGRYHESASPESFKDAMGENQLFQSLEHLLMPVTPADRLDKELAEVSALKHQGSTEIDGQKVDHVILEQASPQGTGQMHLFFAQGEQPTLRRAKLKMPANPLDIQINYTPMATDPVDARAFKVKVPQGADQVQSLAEVFQMPQAQAEPSHPLEGKAAPEFSLSLLDGGEMTLSSHKGQDIVVLDFWATWCPPCVRGLPILAKVTNDFADRNVVFYAVNLREGKDKIRSFLKKQGLAMSVPMDDGGVASKYQVRGIPQTVIIGRDGKVHHVHVGVAPDMESQLRDQLDALVHQGEDMQ